MEKDRITIKVVFCDGTIGIYTDYNATNLSKRIFTAVRSNGDTLIINPDQVRVISFTNK